MLTSEQTVAPSVEKKPAEDVPLGPDGKSLTKSALKKLQKGKEKAEKAAACKAKEDVEKAAREAANVDRATEFYGKEPLNNSAARPRLPYTQLYGLSTANDGQEVTVLAHVQNSRAQDAKMVFLVLRQNFQTMQALVQVAGDGSVSKQMVKWAAASTYCGIRT